MNSFEKDVVKLLSSPHYQKLATYKPPFDLFDVIGCNEIRYSRILAWLLKDPDNREFRQKFLSHVTKENRHKGMDETIDVVRGYINDQKREIDVFVCLENLNENLKFVIAIEVKIGGGEEKEQISDYQNFLERKFNDWKKAVVFLTPYGELPKTASTNDETNKRVPVLCMSWREIADFIDECQGRGLEHDFRVQFKQHIYRSMLMEYEEQKIVIDLLKEGNNKETIDKIIDNRPNLGDDCNKTEFTNVAKKVLLEHLEHENELTLRTYSQKGIVVELYIQVPEWKEKNLPFTLILYNYGTTGVRILLAPEDYSKCRRDLEYFRKINDEIIGSFPEAKEWGGWHAVFADEGDQAEPQNTLIGADIYDDDFWKKVETKLKYQIDKLAPAIKAYTGETHSQVHHK